MGPFLCSWRRRTNSHRRIQRSLCVCRIGRIDRIRRLYLGGIEGVAAGRGHNEVTVAKENHPIRFQARTLVQDDSMTFQHQRVAVHVVDEAVCLIVEGRVSRTARRIEEARD